MAFANSIDEYHQIHKRRIDQIKKWKRRGPITSAKYMAAQCRSMAPRNSGRMIRSIKRNKNTVQVGGTNPKNQFPYVHWVNATPGSGLESVKLVFPFGDGTKKTYAQVARTGTPGFYWKAMNNTRKFNRESAILALRNTLRSTY